MKDSVRYKLTSGKPLKLLFHLRGIGKMFVPSFLWRWYGRRLRCDLDSRADYQYIMKRVAYYNKLSGITILPENNVHEHHGHFYLFRDVWKRFNLRTFHKAYYYDLLDALRWFPKYLRVSYVPGDVYFNPQEPSLVKSRLLVNPSEYAVVLKLDKFRHFLFIKDPIPWKEKENRVIFRGKIRSSRQRIDFLRLYATHPMCDAKAIGWCDGHSEWQGKKKTLHEHLTYKFIMSLEGNDVASNLKWVMSSNSIAVMPRPTCETWYMEGCLQPNYHYIEISSDLSDLEERLNYYIEYPEEAEAIIQHAHEWVEQFLDAEREELIQMLVMEEYFKHTGQML